METNFMRSICEVVCEVHAKIISMVAKSLRSNTNIHCTLQTPPWPLCMVSLFLLRVSHRFLMASVLAIVRTGIAWASATDTVLFIPLPNFHIQVLTSYSKLPSPRSCRESALPCKKHDCFLCLMLKGIVGLMLPPMKQGISGALQRILLTNPTCNIGCKEGQGPGSYNWIMSPCLCIGLSGVRFVRSKAEKNTRGIRKCSAVLVAPIGRSSTSNNSSARANMTSSKSLSILKSSQSPL